MQPSFILTYILKGNSSISKKTTILPSGTLIKNSCTLHARTVFLMNWDHLTSLWLRSDTNRIRYYLTCNCSNWRICAWHPAKVRSVAVLNNNNNNNNKSNNNSRNSSSTASISSSRPNACRYDYSRFRPTWLYYARRVLSGKRETMVCLVSFSMSVCLSRMSSPPK